jgi:hypothetical protein
LPDSDPREFIEAGENVTVLGYLESFARETKQKYHSDWVHVSDGAKRKITRWRGFANTAAPYGYLLEGRLRCSEAQIAGWIAKF